MRHKLLAVTVPLAVLFLTRCADAPTSPQRALVAGKPSLSAIAQTTNSSFPITLFVFVPCAAGGAGEVVELTGELHDLFHVTISSAGRLSLKMHDQPQGLSGVGLTTGDRYQGTGVTQEMTHESLVTGFPFNDTFVNNFRMIGQGPGNNFLVHDNVHVTVDANGGLTSFHDNFNVDCK